MATEYQTASGRLHLPFILWSIDTINLFIHEAGHVLFFLFGRFVYFLGGTLLQVLLPLVTAIVFARTSLHSLLFTLYWTGHSIINASVYMADAPHRALRLISPSAIHDWHWIFSALDMLELAEDIAMAVFILGVLICSSGIAIGMYCLWMDMKEVIKIFLEKSSNS